MEKIKEIKVGDVKCECVAYEGSPEVTYMICPAIVPFKNEWLREMSQKYSTSLVAVYIPADGWNDMLTPWPEPGETKDAEPFGGKAPETLKLLQEQIIPQAEKVLNITGCKERNLIGVSLSGLFTLWQWMLCDSFNSVGCLSGSFWYNGFMQWLESIEIPSKKGEAFFLLGEKEPKAWIKAYRSVGENTEKIVDILKRKGINTEFKWVPGDHFADPTGRAEAALQGLNCRVKS